MRGNGLVFSRPNFPRRVPNRHGIIKAIRRSCGGRESASLYHRAKYLQMAVLGLGGVIVLVWPGPIPWLWVAVAMAVSSAMLARGQWAYYKKHL